MKYVLIAFFIVVSCLSFSQKRDTLVLGEIKQSFCLEMEYYGHQQLLEKRFHGDTLTLNFVADINCAGFHDPSVQISGDSILIQFKYGKLVQIPWSEVSDKEKRELVKYGADTTSGFKEEEAITACDCFYLFGLEVIGVDPTINYCYYFNQRYLGDTTTKTPMRFSVYAKYNDPFENPDIEEGFVKILKETESPRDLKLGFEITVDPKTAKIETIIPRVKVKNKTLEKELMDYAKEHLQITCLIDPITGKPIQNYTMIYYTHNYSDETIISCHIYGVVKL